MDAMMALTTRRSTREFTGEPVAREVLEQIVNAGRLAATARNEQPWEFLVVQDVELRRRIAGLTEYGKFIAQAPACVAVFCKDGRYYLEDGAAASQNILVAAAALGVQSCWVAGDKKDYCDPIRAMLGVPAGYKLISLLALGHAANAASPRAGKRPLESVLHWDQW